MFVSGDYSALRQARLSATSLQGSSVAADKDSSFSEQIQEWSKAFSDLYSDTWDIISHSVRISRTISWMRAQSDLASILDIFARWDFQTVILSLITLLIVAWPFVPRKIFILQRAVSIWFVIWLFFDFLALPLEWLSSNRTGSKEVLLLMAATLSCTFVIVTALSLRANKYIPRQDRRDYWALGLFGILLGVLTFFFVPFVVQNWIPGRSLSASTIYGVLAALWVTLDWNS